MPPRCHGAVTDSPHSFSALCMQQHLTGGHHSPLFSFLFFILLLLLCIHPFSFSLSHLYLFFFSSPFDFRHHIINLWPYLHFTIKKEERKKINDFRVGIQFRILEFFFKFNCRGRVWVSSCCVELYITFISVEETQHLANHSRGAVIAQL